MNKELKRLLMKDLYRYGYSCSEKKYHILLENLYTVIGILKF